MGPFATAAFYRKILEMTPARKDWEHIRTIIDSNPHIPSRSRHVLYGEESPVAGMIDSCNRLANYPVDFIVIPCNSACYFLDQVQPHVSIPILNIMQVTVASLAGKLPVGAAVAVCGSAVTYRHRTYERFLLESGFTFVSHDQRCQDEIEGLIERIKTDDITEECSRTFKSVVDHLQMTLGADAIILGCTEFGSLPEISSTVPLIDSSYELARYTVEYALSCCQI